MPSRCLTRPRSVLRSSTSSNSSSTSRLLCLVLALLAMTCSTHAFAPLPPQRSVPSSLPAAESLQESPSKVWINLPARPESRLAEMLDVELVIGRVAMLGSVAFFAKEVWTGQSVPDQVVTFCTALFPVAH